MKRVLALLAAILLSTEPAAAQVSPEAIAAAKANLKTVLGGGKRDAQMLRGLCAAKEPALLPVLSAVCRGADRSGRLLAVMTAGEMTGPIATELLRHRVREDADEAVRAAAFSYLAKRGQAEEADIAAAMSSKEESLRVTGARIALKAGAARGEADLKVLELLATLEKGSDPQIVDLARLLLLAAGRGDRAEAVGEGLTSPRTSLRQKLLVLAMVETDKISAAAPLLKQVLESDAPSQVKLAAVRALLAVSPAEGAKALAAELPRADMVGQVRLAEMLIQADAKGEHLAILEQANLSLPAGIAAMERARLAGKADDLSAAALSLVKTGHPIVADLVLDRAAAEPNAAYVPALLHYIRSVPPDSRQMQSAHDRAARATAVLMKLSTPEAAAGLEQVLAGPYNAVCRSVAAGLLLSEGACLPRLCEPLLNSPYDELACDAALALGKAGGARSADRLTAIVTHPDRHPGDLVGLASWYLLKLGGQAEAFARELGEQKP